MYGRPIVAVCVGKKAGTDFELNDLVAELDMAKTTLVFDRTPVARIISCAAVFASAALLFDYLSRGPGNIGFLPFLGFTLLVLGTIASALVHYGDRIYVSPHGLLYRNRFLSLFGRPDGWLSWRDVVEVHEIRRKILILVDQEGRRMVVDTVMGYPIARREILRRTPHALISGTLDRKDRP